ncbi:MAG: efflux RND transporter permease subunit [Spirochaetes bacterium]|nr:MAG: efflux RND transporter permease subunit [Spirochaetota bacterium]
MMKLVEFFVENHRITNMIVALVFMAGVFSMLTLTREEMPHMSMYMMRVTTVYPGASPGDVEVNVTGRIEDELRGVRNVRALTSVSMEGMSVIAVRIDEEAKNPEAVKADVREAVARVTGLPEQVSARPRIEEVTNEYPIFELAVQGDASELELRAHARALEAKLREVPGVGTIEKIGYRKREVKVDVRPADLKRDRIAVADVVNAIRARNVRESGGSLDSYTDDRTVVTLAEYERPSQVGEVIVSANFEGYRVRLSDIAVIRDGFEEPAVLYRGNGKPAIALMVTRQEGADILTLSENIREAVDASRKTLPSNVRIEEMYDFSVLTRSMLDSMAANALIGFALVYLVMFFMLDRVSGFWAAFGIPFSIFGTMGLMALFGMTMNMVSLASMIIVLGLLVDDAVVISEKIYLYKQRGMPPVRATIEAVRRMALPVAAAGLTIIVSFLPILFIPGIMGRFMHQIPVVIAMMFVTSLIEGFFFLPAHVCRAQARLVEPRRLRWLDDLKKAYARRLEWAIRNRKKFIGASLAFLAAAFAAAALFLDFKLDEDQDPDIIAIVAETPGGTSLAATSDLMAHVEGAVLAAVPKECLKNMVTQAGHHTMSADYLAVGGMRQNYAITIVYLLPSADRAVRSEKMMDALRPLLADIKKQRGFPRLDIEQYGFAVGRAVELTFITDDDAARAKLEADTLAFLRGTDGVYGIETDSAPGKPEMRVGLDHDAMARSGLTAADVARTLRAAFDGIVATSIRLQGEEIDFRVRVRDGRQDAGRILALPVSNAEGRLVPLSLVARLEEHEGAPVRYHLAGRRAVTIRASVDETKNTPSAVNALLKDHVAASAAGVPGLTVKFGGQEEEAALSMRGFFLAMGVALAAMYVLLVILFRSYLQPVLTMTVIPFALAAVFLTLLIHGMPLLFVSLVAMIGLLGVVLNDAIVMIDQLNQECASREPAAIAAAATDRVRPILLISLTSFVGLVPTSYGIGGDLPLMRPLVLCMGWGVLFCTAVTLFFIPVLYSFVKERGPGEPEISAPENAAAVAVASRVTRVKKMRAGRKS